MQTVILEEACAYYNLQISIRISVGLFTLRYMRTGLGGKNWGGGFIPLLPKQEGLVNNYLLII